MQGVLDDHFHVVFGEQGKVEENLDFPLWSEKQNPTTPHGIYVFLYGEENQFQNISGNYTGQTVGEENDRFSSRGN